MKEVLTLEKVTNPSRIASAGRKKEGFEMKRRLWAVPVVAFLIFACGWVPGSFGIETDEHDKIANAQIETYTWQDKLKRGALNIVSSPVEVARSIQMTTEEKNLLNGWTIGLVRGIGDGLVRLGAGTIDVLTSPFAFPDEKRAPLISPEYVWEKGGVKYS